jgi:ribonucleoside-triphosphate reductase
MGKFKLDDSFIKGYEGKEPNWGQLGWFTFKRTYARLLGTSTEDWTHTVKRVVEGLANIAQDRTVTQKRMQKLYHLIWNLVITPPGRGLWMLGTEFAEKNGDALNNCWFIASRPHHYGSTNKIFNNHEIDVDKAYPSFPYVFLFDMSMKGGGVGHANTADNMAKFPTMTNSVNVEIAVNINHPDYEKVRQDSERLGYKLHAYMGSELSEQRREHSDLYHMISDDREGWAEAYGIMIDSHYFRDSSKTYTIVYDISKIREEGRDIKGFGGKASGPMALAELLYNCNKYVWNVAYLHKGGRITTVLSGDAHNFTGKAVVAGNVRRTAEVDLFDPEDMDCVNKKNYKLVGHVNQGWTEDWKPILKSVDELVKEGLTHEQAEADWYTAYAQNNHRWTSNNSVIIDDPDNYNFGFIAAAIEANGEPGVYNRFLARNYGRIIDGFKALIDPVEGGNPCMEIPLMSGEPCNLFEVHLPVVLSFRNEYQAEFGEELIKVALEFSTWATKRVTLQNYEWEISREVIGRNRRLGVSFSGFQDWVLLEYGSGIKGWVIHNKDKSKTDYLEVKELPEYDPKTHYVEPIYNEAVTNELDRMYHIVVDYDIEYSKILTEDLGFQVNPSIKRTTNKPSGTVSLLSGISPGIHFPYFDYGIRRITVSESDPLLKLAQQCGLKCEPAAQTPNSWKVEFPYMAPAAEKEGFLDATAPLEYQIAYQAMIQMYWADNMVSCTLTFQQHEAHKIETLLEQYKDRIKATSLLPYAGHGYVQAPYQPYEGTKDERREQYEAGMKQVKIQPHELYHMLKAIGSFGAETEDLGIDTQECAGGACPTK